MQSSLDRILNAIQTGPSGGGQFTGTTPAAVTLPSQTTDLSGGFQPPPLTPLSATSNTYYPASSTRSADEPRSKFPPLPGFAPPPHKFATYGIVPSTAPSSDDESEETLPRASLNAPIEALQGLANAAAEAAAAPLSSRYDPRGSPLHITHVRVLPCDRPRKRKRVEPTPYNAFPNVLDKVHRLPYVAHVR